MLAEVVPMLKASPVTKAQRRSLPWSADIEEAILSAIFLDPLTVCGVAIELALSPDHFYLEAHQITYAACLHILHRQAVPDLNSVLTHLQQAGTLEKVGGAGRLIGLLDTIVSTAPVKSWVLKIIEDANRRKGIKVFSQAIEDLHDPEIAPDESFEAAARESYAISSQSTDRYTMAPLSTIAAEAMIELEGEDTPQIPQTGLTEFDRMTGGFMPGYWVIAGRSSMGKSHFGLQLAHSMAGAGEPVLFVSCEMSKKRLFQRLLARESLIPSNRLRDRQIADYEWESISAAMGRLGQMPIEIYDKPNPSELDLRQKINRFTADYGKAPRLIVVDYLQKLRWGGGSSRAYELEAISNTLFQFSADYGSTVATLAQINRGVEGRNDKRPMMSDIKDCGAVEQDADLVITLYRDEYYSPETEERGITEVSIEKSRDGKTGSIKLLSQLEFSRYLNIPSAMPAPKPFKDDHDDF